jgi:hypothetical protein
VFYMPGAQQGASENAVRTNFAEPCQGEVRSKALLGGWVNKGKKKAGA